MLILTRRVGERIVIGDEVTIELVEINGSIARIAIDAPRSIPVHREEVLLAVQEENRAAAASAPTVLPEPPGGSGGAQPKRT